MGFFSSIIGGATRAIGAFLGAPAPAPVQQVQQLAPIPRVGQTFFPTASGGPGPAAHIVPSNGRGVKFRSELGPGGKTGGFGRTGSMCPGGNGQIRKMTIVQSINDEGDVVCEEVLRGAPHLMNRDLAIAKRVKKVASKLGVKFSTKTREPSKRKMLLDVVESRAIENALVGACPTNGSSHT